LPGRYLLQFKNRVEPPDSMTHSFRRAEDASEFNTFQLSSEGGDTIDVDQIIAIARRQWKLVVVCVLGAMVLGVAYLFTAVPIYSASASILIDTSNQKIADQLSAVTGVLVDEASILSQVELIRSDKIALAVSEKLNLKDDASFWAEEGGLVSQILSSVKALLDVSSWFDSGAGGPVDQEQLQQAVVWNLKDHLDVDRIERTYVLTLVYSSANPHLAAEITRAYADAYLTDQLDSKYESTRRASDWLQKRIAELRQKSLETDLAVQKFKAEKGLITTDGQLVSEQQLTQLNSQLILAQADTANVEAKYKRISSILDSGAMEAAVTESLESSIITDLRSKFLEASRREADISSRLGAKHVQAVRLRNEKSEYRRLMFEELARIAQSYKSNLDVALARQKNLEQQVAQATGISANANDEQVQLRELERESETYKKLYETFLQRYQEAVQQQSFPITEARVISNPVTPSVPSAPKKPLVMALSVFLGLLVGACLGAFREFRDRFFRTADQFRSVLELEPLGTVPYARPTEIIKHQAAIAATTNSRVLNKDNSLANYVIDHPLSSFAETMRSAKIAIDIFVDKKRPKTVGFVSVLPGEGKSTVSINFAELLASQGSRVLLIDADLRNPGATRQIGRHAERGILEALQDSVPARDILMINPDTKLAFLPAVIKRRIPYSSELLASEAMDRIIEEVSDAFDYIIFDLPPLAPVVDARAMSSKLDAYIFVVEWGKTARNVVKKTLVANAAVAVKCAGVILNKVDTSKMKFYQSYGSSEFYYSKYSSYYRE
jgi:succinoglycan biosynthesis transport protein ExoP